MQQIWQLARARLSIITVVVGEAFGGLLAMLFYCTLLVPFALISIFTTDPLHRKADGPAWLQREAVSPELDRARRQG